MAGEVAHLVLPEGGSKDEMTFSSSEGGQSLTREPTSTRARRPSGPMTAVQRLWMISFDPGP